MNVIKYNSVEKYILKPLIKIISKLVIGLLFLNLYACDGGNDTLDNATSKATSDLPSELQKLALAGGGELSAYITIDGDVANRKKMTIDNTAGSASVSISGLDFAPHTIMISYVYTFASEDYLLAIAIKNIDLSSGAGSLGFFASDYDTDSFDYDNDGISNAAEFRAGTDVGARPDNSAPVFTSATRISVPENTTATGYTAAVIDNNSEMITYSLAGGIDQALFSIDSSSGILSFNAPADFEMPADSDQNNIYIVGVLATDGVNPVAQNLSITVTDELYQAPVANAGIDQSAIINEFVALDGSDSSGAEDSELTYLWSFVSIPEGSTVSLSDVTVAMPSFTVDVPAIDVSYVVQLIVNDGTTDSEPDTVIIRTGNTPPVANAGPNQQNMLIGDTVFLDGSESYDANQDNISYYWSLISKPVGSTAVLDNRIAIQPSFVVDVSNSNDRRYIVRLVVSDGNVNSETDDVVIMTGNTPPVADAGPNRGGLTIGNRVILDGTGSYDVNGDDISYLWRLNRPAGSNATLSSARVSRPSFVADVLGTYTVQLVVNDGSVNSPIDTTSIFVSLAPPPPPPPCEPPCVIQ